MAEKVRKLAGAAKVAHEKKLAREAVVSMAGASLAARIDALEKRVKYLEIPMPIRPFVRIWNHLFGKEVSK